MVIHKRNRLTDVAGILTMVFVAATEMPCAHASSALRHAQSSTSGERIVRSLRDIDTVQGSWEIQDNVAVSGRVFKTAGVMSLVAGFSAEFKMIGKVVIPNHSTYDFFEATVGFRGGGGSGKVRFRVRGDGAILFTSPWMDEDEPALKISIPIRQYSGVTLAAEGDEIGEGNTAVWGDPVFIKLPRSAKTPPRITMFGVETLPLTSSPSQNLGPVLVNPGVDERLSHPTPFVWKRVTDAAGYLVEIQCISLLNAKDEDNLNRFQLIRLPANITVHNFPADKMPKGKWRWRVHCLSKTGFASQMERWAPFVVE